MNFPSEVKIVEVGPRDGLQNETIIIPTQAKIELINRLSRSGLNTIEVTSFVSPKWIPQLADGEAVFTGIEKAPGVRYTAIIPNVMGLERAIKAGVKEIAILCAASETFSNKNTHCSIAESFNRIQQIMILAALHHIRVRGYISCSLGCPYEGKVPAKTVMDIAKRLFQMGCYEIALGDTIGVGTAKEAQTLVKIMTDEIPIGNIAVHFHDTYGQAIANIYACLEIGVRTIDASIAGLRGCPYAKGASGNVATEDVIYLLEGLGIQTGINLDSLIQTSQFCMQLIHRMPRSKVTQAKLGI